jgi:hypothetical protein
MQSSLLIKKQSRQDENVRRTRLCSLTTFIRDAVQQRFTLVLPPTRTWLRAICHIHEDQVGCYAFHSICHVG